MAGISMGTGLASGIDYSTMITQLMQIEAQPQTLLVNQQSATRTDAAAYREINTAMASLSSAAQALTGTGMTSARKAASTSSTATATAGGTAVPGNSISFRVRQLAASQVSVSGGTWSSATGDVRTAQTTGSTALPDWPLTVYKNGVKAGTVDVKPGGSLNDAAAAINSSGYGLSATVVQLDSSTFKLQITSASTGKANSFQLLGPAETDPTATGAGSAFTRTVDAKDAELDLGNSMTASSSSNTFSELLTGVSVTVSQTQAATDPATVVSVSNDASAVTAKVQAMMDAANTALATIKKHTDATDPDAALKGNWALTSLSSQILKQVSSAVTGSASPTTAGNSPADAGITLNKDGTINFVAATFTSALNTNPALMQQIVGGATGIGADNVRNTPDDTVDVDGIAARLSVLAEGASDSATGMITSLANSQDTRVKDLQTQIDDWSQRLAQRKDTLTAQFNALETALGTLHNQSTWLTGQLDSLPSWSSSK